MGYCSWCLKKVHKPNLKEESLLTRNLYSCNHCGRGIVECRACSNYACWDTFKLSKDKKEERHDQFCAEHRGLVPNFETLNDKLRCPADYSQIYKQKKLNLAKGVKIAGLTVGGVAVMGPLAYFAAPALGGAVGSLMGYSGAVATNAGLALLGGGSLAAGGFGMAGGMVALTVTGAAVGGATGAYVGGAYFGDVNGFSIRKMKNGKGPAIVTVNGFLTEGDENPNDWEAIVRRQYPKQAWYHVEWESKNLRKLGGYMISGSFGAAAKKNIQMAAKKATKQAAKLIGPAATVAQVVSVSTNPWHVAMVKAEKTGVMLGDILYRCRDHQNFILMGHSLGARVIYSALMTLSTAQKSIIKDVHLFGGAVGNQKEDWQQASQKVSGKIANYLSTNDSVLKYLYSAGTFFSSSPIGRNKIKGIAKIKNYDVSHIVGGHGEFKKQAKLYL